MGGYIEVIYPDISIHALREEGDRSSFWTSGTRPRFLSTPSARRATGHGHPVEVRNDNFYPRPPRGGRHSNPLCTQKHTMISIHALREEGDDVRKWALIETYIFLSTPSARRATLPGSKFHAGE